MRPIRFALVLVAALLLPLVALAQEVPVPPPSELDPSALLGAFVGAIRAGQWPVVAVLGFVVAIYLVRKVGARVVPWLGTSEGGTVLALLTTLATVLGAAALAGTPITWGLVGSAAAAAFTAIGSWTGARRLLRVLVPLAARVPSLGPILSKVLGALSGADVAAKVQAATEVAYVPAPKLDARAAAAELSKPPSP